MDTKTATLLLGALFIIQCTQAVEVPDALNSCLDVEGVTIEEADQFFSTNLTLAETNPKLKCYAACILETYKVLDDCTFIYATMKQQAIDENNERISEIADTCKDSVKSAERCECGYELYKCFSESGK